MKITKVVFLILYFSLFTYHCLSSLQSGSESANLSFGLTDLVIKIFKIEVEDVDGLHHIIRKLIGHFAYFGLIGLCGFIAYYFFTESLKYTMIFSSISGVLMSFESEFLQYFANERGPSFIDVLIDYSGYLLTSIVLFAIIFSIKRTKMKKMTKGLAPLKN